MKTPFMALMALMTWVPAVFAAGTPGDFAVERFRKSPFVMAHRACWGPDVPENSLRGIDLCLHKGVDMIEVDIHRTRDDVLVLIHDDTLDRTTNLTGRVADFSHAALKAARLRPGAGGVDAKPGTDSIPTLAQALRRVRGKAILFLDMKIQSERDRRDVLDLVSRENAREYVAMYAFFPKDRAAYLALPEWVRRHSIVPVAESGSFEDRRQFWQPSLAAAVREYGDLQPLAFMVFLKNASFLSSKPAGTAIPLIAAPIFGLAGERDEGFGPRIHGDPDDLWGELIRQGATAFMTNHPLQLLEYIGQATKR